MKAMAKTTTLSMDDIVKKVKDYFIGNLGLKLIAQTDNCCLSFQSNLGYVDVQIFDNHDCREVNLTTREYEYLIQDFLGTI